MCTCILSTIIQEAVCQYGDVYPGRVDHERVGRDPGYRAPDLIEGPDPEPERGGML